MKTSSIYRVVTLLMVTTTLLPPVPAVQAGDSWSFSRKKSAVEKVAKQVAKLERQLDYTGSITAKAPDVWGQARLTQHREEFEKQMRAQLDAFEPSLNAEIAVSDQAYLAQAIALSAVANADGAGGANQTIPEINVSTVSTMVSPIDGVRRTVAPEPTEADRENARTDSTFTVIRTDPFGSFSTDFESKTLTLEPTVLLDQRKRFLQHLHQIRRINEGDDTADAPGYSLNLVRIPVSILPGDRTREGYGAEITITATPHLTEDLLPTTFRALVINDLVDQLSFPIAKFLDVAWPHLMELERYEADKRKVKIVENVVKSLENMVAKSLKNMVDKSGEDMGTAPDPARLRATVQHLYAPSAKDDEGRPRTILPFSPEVLEELEKIQKLPPTADIKKQNTTWPELPEKLRKDAEDFRTEIARQYTPAKNYTEAIWNEQKAQLVATGHRARRSRFALPASQMNDVYGTDELVCIALHIFNQRDRKRCNYASLIADVQGLLREELEAAYDYLTHKKVMHCVDGITVAEMSLWDWVDPTMGQKIRALGENLDSTAMNNGAAHGIRNLRIDFYNAIHGVPTALPTSTTAGPSTTSHLDLEVPGIPAAIERLSYTAQDATAKSEPQYVSKSDHVTEALAWAVLVESVLLNDRLNEDIERVAQDPNCGCVPGSHHTFYGPNPGTEARMVFMDYVRCRWPIRVFALDPETQQQNIADSFAIRREMQLAVALAFSQGKINAQSLTRYMRRLEIDMRTIALNNTIVGFGHGANTFGWRFTPRFQTPPIEGNLKVKFRDLLLGGPGRDALLKHQRLESGPRECVAIVVMPSFIRHVKFDTRSNWFRLTTDSLTRRGDSGPTMDYVMDWSRDIKSMQDAVYECMETQHLYRDGEVDRLMARVEQLSQELPMQTMYSQVPYENTIGGFEMFSSGVTDLAPELIGFYGVPGIDPSRTTKLFLVGNHFSVHDTRVMAGNRMCKVSMLSRQVMEIDVPAGVQTHKRKALPPADIAYVSGISTETTAMFPIPENSALAGLKPDKFVPCGPGITERDCPRLCNPCCNDEVVEIRLATPYGMTGSIEVPVVSSDVRDPQLEWATGPLSVTYYYTEQGMEKIFTIANADIRVSEPHSLAIRVPNGVVFPSRGATKLELSISGLALGAAFLQVPDTGDLSAPLNLQSREMTVAGTHYKQFHESLKASVQTYMRGAKYSGIPAPMVVQVKGKVYADAQTSVPISGELLIQIDFVKN